MPTNCKMCGTPNEDGVQFCAACGSPMSGPAGQARREAPKQKGGVPAKTMMFGVAPQVQAPAPTPAPAQAPAAAPMAKVAPVQAPAPAQTQQDQAAALAAKRTVLGVPAVTSAQPPQPAPKPAPAPMAKPVSAPAAPAAPPVSQADALAAKHTVLGMPAMNAADIAKEIEAAKQKAAQPAPAAPAASPAAPTAPQPAQPAPAPAAPQAQQPARPATEPLEPVRKAPEPTPAPKPAPPRSYEEEDPADTWPDDDDDMPPRKKSGGGLLIIAIVAGLVVLAGVGLILYLLVFKGSSELQPSVIPSPDGETLTVALALPEAPAGTTVQVQGQTVQVMGGQAQFNLPLKQMKLGSNPVQVIYTEPGSAPETMSFPIMVRHTVTTDLSGLVAADPFFVVNFAVAPGIQLAVNGKPVQPMGGSYAHRVLLSSVTSNSGTDNLIHKIAFQLTGSDGMTEGGQQVVTIPMTKLQIDRPAADAMVAMEAVTCAGVSEEGATVTVNGAPTGVVAGSFNTTVPLEAIGEHPIKVTARAPGKAPRTEIVKVTRIQSMDTAIEEWSKDLDKKLDYPTLAREPAAHTGKKVKFSGRVVNISTQKGVTAFLLYVGKGCPAGAKCAVYVAFRGETDAGLQSMVSVYGSVRGTWDVDLQGGRKETMPAVDAKFVVKEEDAKKRRR